MSALFFPKLMGRGWRHDWGVAPVWLGLFIEFVSAKSSARRTGAGGGEVSKYVSGRGGVERSSLCQRGEASLVFVEVEGEMLEVKETPVFQQAPVAFLRERGVSTEDLRPMAWQVLGKIWYRPRLLWRFLRNQPPPDDFGET